MPEAGPRHHTRPQRNDEYTYEEEGAMDGNITSPSELREMWPAAGINSHISH